MTRAKFAQVKLDSAKEAGPTVKSTDRESIDLDDTFMSGIDDVAPETFTAYGIHTKNTRESIIEAQHSDPELKKLFDQALSLEEAENTSMCYTTQDGLLVRKWRCPLAKVCHHWDTLYQIVVPRTLRSDILELGHDCPLASHLGVNKTKARISEQCYWPGIGSDVASYVRSCHTCQVVGKPR
jgi:hypothetical protein